MKTYYCFAALLLLSMSCKEEETGDDPTTFRNYFQIVDAATGEDWFLTHSNYKLDSVKLFAYDQSDNLIPLELPHAQINNKIVFGPLDRVNSPPEEAKYLLHLSEDDIDTLEWIARACDGCYGKYMGSESFSFYYNGELSAHLDFHLEDDQNADDWIVIRLAETNNSLTDSTYVMTFEKK